MNKKRMARAVCSAIFVIVTLYLLQRLLVPKYASDVVEGNLIAEYYEEEKNHDVIFIGDCEVYENFSPKVLWEKYGINSYIRGSAQQLIWQSYYLLEDTLRYEKPEVVIFNVLALKYDEPQKEAYNRMSLEGMRWSVSKVKAILASMTEDEHFLDYVFPILRYHSRWNELGEEDLEYLFRREPVSHNGYYMRVDVKPAENVPEGRILADYQFGENACGYLDKMTELCRENDIQLVLVKAPSLYPYWYEEWEEQVEAYAAEHKLLYINFLELTEETGLDFSQDTYDGGLHLNLTGAEKITDYLGKVLTEECALSDRRGEAELSRAWEEKISAYEQEIAEQKKMVEQQEISGQ
ncbi:MAG: SGNH/GDSL hydrolase family protein [Lachnospiraceae bacterium]|nr:SGNH/GDSL hydrolase family protein [uncultured Acetatifactor sp.]MCI8286988.1 SGNH/GDSL hydrolase family protein [Lachnospiraceae bacterium]